MTTLLVTFASYALGCFSTAYYLFRFSTGSDIRNRGSGNAGARNIGRQLGSLAFIATFLIDFTKGAATVWLARYFELGDANVVIAMLAVVAGHVWPAQLGFRGGKGIATAIGALVAFDHRLPIPSIVIFGIAAPLFRNLTLGGLVAIALTPVAAAIFHRTAVEIVGAVILTAIVIFAHRGDLGEIFANTPADSDDTHDPLLKRRQQ